jgi:hypothetical protein
MPAIFFSWRWSAWLSLVAAVLLVSGCERLPSTHPAHASDPRQIESVTDAGGGRFWFAGPLGRAGYFDGHTLRSIPYPLSAKASDYTADRFPAEHDQSNQQSLVATIALLDGEPFLFTRTADIFRLSPQATWVPLTFSPPLRFPEKEGYLRVIRSPSGGQVVLGHGVSTLLFPTAKELLQGVLRIERTPRIFLAAGFLDGVLHGIFNHDPATAHRDQRGQRELFRYEGPRRWSFVCGLPIGNGGASNSLLVAPDGRGLLVPVFNGFSLTQPSQEYAVVVDLSFYSQGSDQNLQGGRVARDSLAPSGEIILGITTPQRDYVLVVGANQACLAPLPREVPSVAGPIAGVLPLAPQPGYRVVTVQGATFDVACGPSAERSLPWPPKAPPRVAEPPMDDRVPRATSP